MSDRAPYSRVYWTIRSDDRLGSVYPSDANLAAWLRLLIAADMAYPAPADIPASVNPRALKALEGAGVITVQGTLFTFHGLKAERERRQTGPKRTPEGTQTGPGNDPSSDSRARAPRLVSSSLVSSPEGGAGGTGLTNVNSTVAGIWETATGHTLLASSAYAQERLDDMCRRHPPSEVGASILRARASFDHIPEDRALIVAMLKLLDPISREAPKPPSRRSGTKDPAVVRAAHNTGAHVDAPSPECALCAEAAS